MTTDRPPSLPPSLPPPRPAAPYEATVARPTHVPPADQPVPGVAPRRPMRPGLAVAAFVLGILSVPLFVFAVLALLALIFGLNSARQIKSSNGRLTGLWMARTGWILGAGSLLTFCTLMALVATGVVGGDDEVPDNLEVGDCVRLDENADLVLTIPTVDCAEVHNGEVIFIGELNPSGSETYPGDVAAETASGEACLARWPDTIGVSFQDSVLDVYWFPPDKSRWKRDRGSFICMATSFERDLTSTVAGSGR